MSTNPYLDPAYLALLATMPRYKGTVRDPRRTPPRDTAWYTQAWREWAGQHPKEQWPEFLHEMAFEKAYWAAKQKNVSRETINPEGA